MRIKTVYFILLFSFFCSFAYTQNISGLSSSDSLNKKQNVFNVIGNDIKISFEDGIRTFTSPLHFDTKDGLTALGVLTTTALLFTVDDETRDFFAKQKSDFNDHLSDAGYFYGTIYPTLIVGGGLYTYGLFGKDEYTRVTGRMAFESVAIAGLITTLTKSLLGRHRPYNNDGSFVFKGPTFNDNFLSMPSGHATVAFALSTTLANRFHNVFASIGLYTLAGITALSRIYEDKHWASDVFLGSAIGYFVGDFISGRKDGKTKYQIVPKSNGIGFIYYL
jgi:hypothetical protein